MHSLDTKQTVSIGISFPDEDDDDQEDDDDDDDDEDDDNGHDDDDGHDHDDSDNYRDATYLPTYLPIDLHTYLLTYLLNYKKKTCGIVSFVQDLKLSKQPRRKRHLDWNGPFRRNRCLHWNGLYLLIVKKARRGLFYLDKTLAY